MCFLTLPVFACVIHYLWLGREIAQCNWSESKYCISLSLVFRVFTTFAITVISESMKSMKKIIRKESNRKVVKFYTYVDVKKKNRKKIEKRRVGCLF